MRRLHVLLRDVLLHIPPIRRIYDERNVRHAEVKSLREQLQRNTLDNYDRELPTAQEAFRIFDGEWSSKVPGFGFGQSDLFNDHRIAWLENRNKGFGGKPILELGPLEGGHTYMIAKAGPAQLIAIESNRRAFLKCLIVKNALNFSAEILLGDFEKYVRNCKSTFDFVLASGVLYHMEHPVSLLADIAKITDSIGLWTHYYDPKIIAARDDLRRKFNPTPEIQMLDGQPLQLHRQHYHGALDWAGFCGGPESFSYWFTRDSLLKCLDLLGFDAETGDEAQLHQNGPCILIYARRRR
jgi:hypothetical protein